MMPPILSREEANAILVLMQLSKEDAMKGIKEIEAVMQPIIAEKKQSDDKELRAHYRRISRIISCIYEIIKIAEDNSPKPVMISMFGEELDPAFNTPLDMVLKGKK